MLAVNIDERGLDDVWFEGRSEAPAGPLACISNAVYQMDWSSLAGLAEQRMKLTVPMKYESGDGGTDVGR